MFADLSLENWVRKDVIEKIPKGTLSSKALRASCSGWLCANGTGMSIQQACTAMELYRLVYHYQPDGTRDDPIIEVLAEWIERYPLHDFRKLFIKLRAGPILRVGCTCITSFAPEA